MPHHFKYDLNDYVEFTFEGYTLTGTIYGTDLESGCNNGYYLIGYDPSYYDKLHHWTETKMQALGNLYEDGDSNIVDNIPDNGLFVWAAENCVLEVLMKASFPKQEVSKPVEEKDFGRWLSGIDQYSEDNYKRGNSGFNWL